jgi:hypothetical protein
MLLNSFYSKFVLERYILGTGYYEYYKVMQVFLCENKKNID